ncbi:MAG: UvrD-helicase domain-containing protein [Myxococcaceae bacterium]
MSRSRKDGAGPRDERQLDLFGLAAPAAPPPVVDEAPADATPAPGSELRLERNLALLAGAGAGKTHSLVTICLHLLGGARRGYDALEPARLGLLTFTEKAADEMRSRLRERLEALADGRAQEPVLTASFAAAGLPFPTAARWRFLRDELGSATIGTFHSLCSQLLRRAPPGSRVRAGFELLDERDASRLLGDVVERALLSRLERGSGLRSLVAEIGFSRFVSSLVPIATRIREEGIAPDFVNVADGPGLRAQFDTELRGLKFRSRSVQPSTPAQIDTLNRIRLLADAATFESFEKDGEALQAAAVRVQGQVGELRDVITSLRETWVACQLAPQEAEVRELLTEIFGAHEEQLARRGVLDFTGLLVEARNLLRDSPEARREAQARFGALLVDEFQDTNRLQLELVLLLAEKRRGAPRPVSTAFEHQHREIVALPQEHGFLAVVGDRKQSIYEFRGADVSVFEVMARAIERNDGVRAFLRHSRRSTPKVLEALNRGFAFSFRPPAEQQALDFEIEWQPEEDALLPVREASAPGEALVQLFDSRLAPKLAAEQLRQADAEAIATALANTSLPLWTLADGQQARGGDVAVLFQRFTQLETYRQALVRAGVRHRVVRGRGFYGAQEIVDLSSLLALLADPSDALAMSGVLRSPLVGLTDAEWVALARPRAGQRWHFDALSVWQSTEGPLALREFRARFGLLREARDRLGLHTLLRVVIDELGLRVAYAAGPFGEQAIANLDKLLVLASAREREGVSVAQFASELLALADDAPREAQAEVVDELDPDTVTLCTVHQAKGLEWPIVVLPDLAVAPRNEVGAVRFDRHFGLGIARPRGETEVASKSAADITKRLSRRARAEHARLLYVAMTRARDRVVLGLRQDSAHERTWAKELSAFFPLQVAGTSPSVIDVATWTAPRRSEPAPATGQTDDTGLDQVIARVRAPQRVASRALVLPVTQLQDHASCPRRFHLVHHVGLGERHEGLANPQVPDDGLELDGEARERGIAAHRLLELTPLSLVHAAKTDAKKAVELRNTLRELRRREGLERLATDDVLGWIERFWHSAFVASLASLEVHRELPFALRVEQPPQPALVLKGQIDLLAVSPTELTVIDFKTTAAPPTGPEPWRTQLSAYAIAARRLSGRSVPVRTGVVFLRDENPEPRFLPALDGGVDLTSFESSLLEGAAALEASQRSRVWRGRPRSFCESIGCGYVYRCHP